MLNLETEMAALIFSLLGALGTGFSVIWVKVVKPLMDMLKNHDYFKEAVSDIKKELTTNGGNSIKDAIIDLRGMCTRIEKRQKIIEQRTKAALHYSNVALFETDTEGRLIWNNIHLCEMTKTPEGLEGYDWLTCIAENDREELLHDFTSCLQMNRKFVRNTKTADGKDIRIVGYPYRITDEQHGGFLISISEKGVE